MQVVGSKTVLPFGNGRSYGDVCLNDGGVLLNCRRLDRFIKFDPETGILRCESGVLLSEILKLIVPRGWFLQVTPGTQFVTVGGAIANDVHGKNHHRNGTFGRHVRALELLRSDGARLVCSPTENSELFAATIGGLGLTGVITWAEISLKPIRSAYVHQEVIRYRCLDEFFALAGASDRTHEYTVAWIDCLATGPRIGRGFFIRGNHAEGITKKARSTPSKRWAIPIDPPFSLVNGIGLKIFNALYYRKQIADRVSRCVHYQSHFYPLDRIHDWNRIYGSKGFFQYQCAIPEEGAREAIKALLSRIAASDTGSFLTVLKVFGDMRSPGLLSFPRPGATLAVDFSNNGKKTLELLDQLDDITRDFGGAVNPSKDARMGARDFQRGYPSWRNFERYVDNKFSSTFWRRVTRESPK